MRIFSLKGKVIFTLKDYIVIENNDIGYPIYVSRPEKYLMGEFYKLYIYNYRKEDTEYIVGFPNLEEKRLFEKLFTVRGIGPKTALQIIGNTNHDELLRAIESNNIAYLRRIPGIGNKAAAQILLDLQGNYIGPSNNKNINQYDEVRAVLKNLKFKSKEIDDTLCQINIPNATNEQIIKEALKLLEKKDA